MAANTPDADRLITVGSHVVTGYVGNRSATFPLQLLGWDVDVVNTTQLSNHTGYGQMGGKRVDAELLRSVFEGMEKNGLLRYSRMLTGYTPSPSALNEVMTFVQKMKYLNSNVIYLLDPVMGEIERGFYVDKECLPLYKQLVSLAHIICPNQFEAQQLSGMEISSLKDARKALDTMHCSGATHVIITSVTLPQEDLNAMGEVQRGDMILLGSTQKGKPWFIAFPEFKGYYVGVGDLFSALLIGQYDPTKAISTADGDNTLVNTPLSLAVETAIAGMQGVLRNTEAYIHATPPMPATITDAAQQRVETMRRRELRLVQSRQAIEHSTIVHRAHWLP